MGLNCCNLSGTTWKSDDNENSIEFISKTQVKYVWMDHYNGKLYPQEENGIYTVDKTNITLDFGDGDPMKGIIEGNSMTFVWLGDVFIAKKQ